MLHSLGKNRLLRVSKIIPDTFEDIKIVVEAWRGSVYIKGPMSDAIRKLIGRDNAIKGKNETRN